MLTKLVERIQSSCRLHHCGGRSGFRKPASALRSSRRYIMHGHVGSPAGRGWADGNSKSGNFCHSTQNSEPPSISLTMAGESQASFSPSVRKKIRDTYQYRCVICLLWIDTTQCAHILDGATPVRFIAKSRYSIVQVLTLVLLSFPKQSDLAFYMKGLKGMQIGRAHV